MERKVRLAFHDYGRLRAEFRWDETPHVFTNSATSLFVESSPGVFIVAAPVRASLQASPTSLPLVLTGAQPVNMSLTRKQGSGIFICAPTPEWTLQLQYSREEQRGFRPFGTTTNSFSNSLELPEPIDYRTHQAKVSAEYGGDRGGFQASYSTSIFSNQVSQLIWDNPFRTTDAAGGGSRGRLDLYPDNSASALGFAGAFNLNGSTRLMASISPQWMRQNDPFLPFTINAALTGLPQLPAPSPNARKRTLAMNYTLTSNPLPAVELTARYRSYDYNNDTPSLLFPSYVTTDGSLTTLARRNLPYSYDRHTLGLESSWQFLKRQALKLGYEWERFDREHRDVDKSHEHSGSVSLDLNPKKWLLLRASYKRSARLPRHYEPNSELYPLGIGLALGQLEGLRKFDQAARNRDQADVLLQIDPSDRLTFSASHGTAQDRYKESLYGLSRLATFYSTVDLSYQLRPEISLFADYALERYRSNQRSRQRVPQTPTAPVNDSPNNDWESSLRDAIHTWGGGISASGLRRRLTLDAFYGLSVAKGSLATSAPGNPALPGFLVTTAQGYPQTSNRFHQVTAAARFRLPNNVSPRLEYRYERYGRADFQIAPMRPYMVPLDATANTSIFLGADVPGYQVHIVSFGLEYRF